MRTGKLKGNTASGRSMNRTSPMPNNSNYLFTSVSTSQKQPIESAFAAAAAIYSTSIANSNIPEPRPYCQPRARGGPPHLLATMGRNPSPELQDRAMPDELTPLHHTNVNDQTPNTQVSMPRQSQNSKTTTAAMSAALSVAKHSTSVPGLVTGSSAKHQTPEPKTVNNLPKPALKNNENQTLRGASIDNSTSSLQDATLKHLKTRRLRERHPTFASVPEVYTVGQESLDELPTVVEAQAKPNLKRSKTQIFRDQLKALKDDHKQGSGDIDIVVSGVRGWIRRIKIKHAEKIQLKNLSTVERFQDLDPNFNSESKPQAKISSGSEINLVGTTSKTLGGRFANIAKRFKSHRNGKKQQTKVVVTKKLISQPFDFVEGVRLSTIYISSIHDTLTTTQDVAHEKWSRDRPGANERPLFQGKDPSGESTSLKKEDPSSEPASFEEKDPSGESASFKNEDPSGLGIYLDSQATPAHIDLPLHPKLAEPKPVQQAEKDGESDSESAITNWSEVIAKVQSPPGHHTLQEHMPTEDETAKLEKASTKLKPISVKGNVGRTGKFDFPYSSNPLPEHRRPINHNLIFWSQTHPVGKVIKKAKVFKSRVEDFRCLSECASLRGHICSPSTSCFECLQTSEELEKLIASNCRAAQETCSSSKVGTAVNATAPEIAPHAEYSSSSHPLTASALASHNAITRPRNPYEFEPEDEDPRSRARGSNVRRTSSDSVSAASTPTPAPRNAHALLAAAKRSAAQHPPSPSVYSFRSHRRSHAISVRATNTHAFLTQAAAAAAAQRRPPSPSVSSVRGHRRSHAVSVRARDVPGFLAQAAAARGVGADGAGEAVTESRLELRRREGKARGGGARRGRGRGRGNAARETSLEGMVRAELRSEDDDEYEEGDGAERNTVFYHFYDDIFDEEVPPVPRVDERWL